jgi:RNA polymerase sigma-70 factor (family 1)
LNNEQELIQAIINGDKHAFAALYKAYSDKVYNIAISYTKNAESAQDITQDVFVKIYKYAAKFNWDSALNTWIYRIVVNTCLNYIKKQNKLSIVDDTPTENQSVDFNHPGVLIENKENAAILYQVLGKLPNSQKTAFILSYIEELPRQEVADIMETSLKAVESLLQRAKTNMRNELGNLYPHRRKLKK